MAKGQMRSNKEAKKPKKDKVEAAVSERKSIGADYIGWSAREAFEEVAGRTRAVNDVMFELKMAGRLTAGES